MPSFNILPIAPLVFDIPFIYKDDSRKVGFARLPILSYNDSMTQ